MEKRKNDIPIKTDEYKKLSSETLAENFHEKIDIGAISQDAYQSNKFADYFKEDGELANLPDS